MFMPLFTGFGIHSRWLFGISSINRISSKFQGGMLLWRECYNHSTQLVEKKWMGNAGGKCREKKHTVFIFQLESNLLSSRLL